MESQLHRYGDDPSQYGVLYGEGPVAVVIHGGFWKAQYGLDLMDDLCADLAARGWAAWNIEYRRLGNGGGVPETLDDVCAAIEFLEHLPVDRSRVVTIGHSAGGHLAAYAATRVRVTGVVSQAGVLDLARARELRLSDGVVDRFLGEHPTSVASPIERLPLGVPTLLTHGGKDDIVPVEISQRFAAASGAALIVEPDEDHFGHIDPDNPLWKAVLAWL
ncbi:alpha/beta hydrolase [Solirubrobacter sp. CPCC 204708]|uniref:Alpha/beta hydrolase n=1 Tax=Solirubrobacter deserti TaxID=2282478 RepID=A0ABT4RKU9_9ACTN|nr:alpha/beta hydrolase [Solirubrobacter deserti]MBE2317334.1 alpha/beta hydrolase [Solirubrobacter deserti]MDA0139063.1 alpha/beta hydrolase [Solirubrobacter deserti]